MSRILTPPMPIILVLVITLSWAKRKPCLVPPNGRSKTHANMKHLKKRLQYKYSIRSVLFVLPIVVIKEIDDAEVFQLALIENLQRADLTPLEEAKGYRQLLDSQGLTQEALAKILSKSRSAIANTLRLMDLPVEVQEMMEQGLLTAGHARAILAVSSEEGRIKLAEKVVKENLTVRQTEALAPLFSGEAAESKPRTPAPQSFKRAARQLRQMLDTNVKVKQVRGKNKIEIEFKDDDELMRIMSQIQPGQLGDVDDA